MLAKVGGKAAKKVHQILSLSLLYAIGYFRLEQTIFLIQLRLEIDGQQSEDDNGHKDSKQCVVSLGIVVRNRSGFQRTSYTIHDGQYGVSGSGPLAMSHEAILIWRTGAE